LNHEWYICSFVDLRQEGGGAQEEIASSGLHVF